MSLPSEVQVVLEAEYEDLLDHIDHFSHQWGDQEVLASFKSWLNTRMGGNHKITREYENKGSISR